MKAFLGLAVVLAAVGATAAFAGGTSHVFHSNVGPKVPVLVNCDELMAEPWNLTLSCADANYDLVGMTWTGWGSGTATGAGFAHVNACLPKCSTGKFHDFPVVARASAPSACASGQAQYTRLVLTYAGTRPAGVGKTDTWKFPCGIPESGPTISTSASPGRKVILSGSDWPTDHTQAKTCDRTVALGYQRNGKGVIGQATLTSTGTFQVTWRAPRTGFVVITGKQFCNGVTPAPAHSLDGFYYVLISVDILK